MKILSQRKGFDGDHSSVSYEFISNDISKDAKDFARESSRHFKIHDKRLKIQIFGEHYLNQDIQDTLLEKLGIPLLIYEDYDSWNFIIMFEFDKKLMKELENFDGVGEEDTIHVSKKGQKIELWITVHINYGCFDESPFEDLGDMFMKIRKKILEYDFESLLILKRYCNGESKFNATSDLYKRLQSILNENRH
ncbi:MAG TPA: hypothetical protein VFF28_02285 [Candidatus Nanoarchaeia archaeon]|nr:hypothetical protein [Candidatus Nanoarchaeia archaeon]